MNLSKIERQLQGEAERQMEIIFPATAIALKKYFDWGSLKIEHLFDEVANVYDECSDGGIEVSMIQMLEEQTGINLKAEPNGKSWRELCFLNHEITLGSPNKSQLTEAQFYAMRVQQIKWVSPAVLAAVFIALYRKFRFSRPMLQELMGYIDQIRQQYKFKAKKIQAECYNATGIQIIGNQVKRGKE